MQIEETIHIISSGRLLSKRAVKKLLARLDGDKAKEKHGINKIKMWLFMSITKCSKTILHLFNNDSTR